MKKSPKKGAEKKPIKKEEGTKEIIE